MRQIFVHFLIWLLSETKTDTNKTGGKTDIKKDFSIYVDGALVYMSEPKNWHVVTIYATEIKE